MGVEKFGRKSEREVFLDRMEQVMPWIELLALMEPHYPATGLSILLRIFFMQKWFNLSDTGMEEALYESPLMRRFAGVDLRVAAAPDEIAIHQFRELLEKRDLGGKLLTAVSSSLDAQGIRIATSTNADATIIDAPSSTEERAGVLTPMTDPNEHNDQRYVAADAHTVADSTKVDAPETWDTTRGRTKVRAMTKVEPPALNSGSMSVAVISPNMHRRNAAICALNECTSDPIREFTSYPPNLNDVPRTLNRDFEVVVVDLDSDPEYALDLVKSICINGLATVIVYSAETDPELLLRCMRAGAREFLTMPFAPGTMADALLRTSALRSAVRPKKKTNGKLLVFLSAKGGSGVTTLACNFAVSLAQDSGQKTLLIDMNLPLGDAAINLGINSQHSVVSALQHSNRLDSNFLSGLLEAHSSGLSVLAAPSQLAPTHVSDEAIDKLLEVARQEFDYVVVDAGSKLDLQSTHLFDASASLYLVTQVGIAELRNSNRLISRLSTAGCPKFQIVLNRYDPRNLEIAEEHITKALTRAADWKIPNNYAAVRRMQNTATSLMQDDSEISQAIREMTRSVTGQAAIPEKKKRFSFFR
jgi:pilus assembly protein CpaE